MLGDATLWNAFGTQLTELVNTLGSNGAVQVYAGEFTTQFVTEARELISGLARVSTEIERDPRRFLFGDHSRGVEAR